MSVISRPASPYASKRPSRPPLDDHETSMVAARPSAKRMIIMALSSPVVRSPWTSVAPQANTSVTARSLPNRKRAYSAPCEAMSSSAPPPASSASQKCAACGPEWPSRARTVVRRPMAPASTMSRIRSRSGLKITFSR